MEQIKLRWTGIRPLLMNNGAMVDPLNPIQRQIKDIVRRGARKMTETHYAELYRLKWEGAIYFDEQIGPFVPNDNIESCLKFGARKLRMGKQAESAILVMDDIVKLEYKGPRTMEALYVSDKFKLMKRTNMGTMNVRPMFTGWSVLFGLEFDDTVLNHKDMLTIGDAAGKLVGMGDWRPKFGRFLSEEV